MRRSPTGARTRPATVSSPRRAPRWRPTRAGRRRPPPCGGSRATARAGGRRDVGDGTRAARGLLCRPDFPAHLGSKSTPYRRPPPGWGVRAAEPYDLCVAASRTRGGPMPEAVIVATARSPIGRANKGSLTTLRPDDMSAQIVRALLDKVPQLDRTEINDLMMGIGQPAGEGGFNIARVTAILAGLDDVPGVTVNRYCSSSLQTIRMAVPRHQGGRGRLLRRRRCRDREPLRRWSVRHRAEPDLQRGGRADAGPLAGRPGHLDARGGTARHLHRDGADGGERRRGRGAEPRRDGPLRRPFAEPGLCRHRERVLRAGDHPGDPARRHGRRQGRRPPSRHELRGGEPAEAGVPS